MDLNIDIKDCIELDDGKEYVVASKVKYKDLNYFYLVDLEENTNLKFCYEDPQDHTLVKIVDEDLIQELLPRFVYAAKDIIEELKEDEII